jgi:hypothetical protein
MEENKSNQIDYESPNRYQNHLLCVFKLYFILNSLVVSVKLRDSGVTFQEEVATDRDKEKAVE